MERERTRVKQNKTKHTPIIIVVKTFQERERGRERHNKRIHTFKKETVGGRKIGLSPLRNL